MTSKRTLSLYVDRHLIMRAKLQYINLSQFFAYSLENYFASAQNPESLQKEENKRGVVVSSPFSTPPPPSSEEVRE